MTNSQRSTNLLISLATGPLLVALVAGRAIAQFTQALGETSEELFRGDRLPTLHIPNPESGAADSENP